MHRENRSNEALKLKLGSSLFMRFSLRAVKMAGISQSMIIQISIDIRIKLHAKTMGHIFFHLW